MDPNKWHILRCYDFGCGSSDAPANRRNRVLEATPLSRKGASSFEQAGIRHEPLSAVQGAASAPIFTADFAVQSAAS